MQVDAVIGFIYGMHLASRSLRAAPHMRMARNDEGDTNHSSVSKTMPCDNIWKLRCRLVVPINLISVKALPRLMDVNRST